MASNVLIPTGLTGKLKHITRFSRISRMLRPKLKSNRFSLDVIKGVTRRGKSFGKLQSRLGSLIFASSEDVMLSSHFGSVAACAVLQPSIDIAGEFGRQKRTRKIVIAALRRCGLYTNSGKSWNPPNS